jgi:hypothetical protein
VNSEELERSLRSEFENYLRNAVDQMREQVSEFQQRVVADLDRQRQLVEEAFSAFGGQLEAKAEFDEAFLSSISEHLKLARDEGAKITATAFAEAEKLQEETAPAVVTSYDKLRDAVSDISSKDSQSSILKSLVTQAAEFAPRGAFFIIKNEHLAGWKVFGEAGDTAENAIREVHFPLSDDSILGASVRSNETIDSAAGAHAADAAFLDPLGFGHPDRMYAIPLIARGRSVAVLYADYGNDGSHLSREALETLVRVAGLTVELLAANASAVAPEVHERDLRPTGEREAPAFHEETPAEVKSEETGPSFEQPVQDFTFSESVSYQGGFPQAETSAEEGAISAEPVSGYQDAAPEYSPEQTDTAVTAEFDHSHSTFESGGTIEPAGFPEVHGASPFEQPVEEPVTETAFEPVAETAFEAQPSFEGQPAETSFEAEPVHEFKPEPEPAPSFSQPEPAFEPAQSSPFGSFETVPAAPVAPAVEKSVVPVPGSRLSDRPVDLPIEVPEEERRSHNDARRFARLLVSEIKLYNEKKVLEGRQSRDLYERLREAIDRSREMYDKRVQPPVAAKFDYFHYELVNSLAEGEPGRLGNGYPGPTI